MKEQDWDLVIKPKPGIFYLGLKEVYAYRDLVILFVKRDIVAQYKQTVLGPLWLIIQPLLSTLFFTIIFGNFAKFSSGDMPYPVFTLSGLTIWNFFASSLSKTSSVFVSNASIFGKVYFPRLTVPVSAIIANIITFFIQFLILIILLLYYRFANGYNWEINYKALALLPFLLIVCGLFGMGCGLIISAVTTKYRDLAFLVGFVVQFVMYFSSVVFPLNNLSAEIVNILSWNPLLHLVNLFRAAMVNSPVPDVPWMCYSIAFTIVVLFSGIIVFNKVEKSFMDTV